MTKEAKKIKVLLTKGILDAHDRGVRTVAMALMNAGIEVVFTEYRVPEDIVNSASQEDVDVIGISFSAGGQTRVSKKVMEMLTEKGVAGVPVIVGGSIPPDDVKELKRMGVSGVFRQGTPLGEIISCIKDCADKTGRS